MEYTITEHEKFWECKGVMFAKAIYPNKSNVEKFIKSRWHDRDA